MMVVLAHWDEPLAKRKAAMVTNTPTVRPRRKAGTSPRRVGTAWSCWTVGFSLEDDENGVVPSGR